MSDGFAHRMANQCGAKTRSGTPCKQPGMENGRCRLHGGKSPRGIASPHFIHGRYAKILKGTSLGEIYEAVQQDPELLNLSSEIMLVQSRLHELVGKIPAEDSGGRWKLAQKHLDDFRRADAKDDMYERQVAMNKLNKTIVDGGKDSLMWEEILRTLKSYSDLIAKEQKRRMDMNALVSVDQAVGLLAEVLMAVKENVTDQRALVMIHNRVSDALNKRPHLAVAIEQQKGHG